MQLTKISRSKSFEMLNGYGLKMWDKIGIEAELSEGENPIDGYQELDKIIHEVHKESNPLYYLQAVENQNIVQVDKIPDNPVYNMIKAITTCTEVATLKTFEKLAKSNEKFQQAYDETMIKLTNKTD